MSEMNIEYINPFLVSASSVLQSMCGMQLTPGKPYVRDSKFDNNSVAICIGVTGQIGGQVLLAFHNEFACEIASKMCMMPIETLDEISLSALCELGNMILGNAATVLSTKNIIIDITPPTVIQGIFHMESTYAKNICIPLTYEGNKTIEVDISLKERS